MTDDLTMPPTFGSVIADLRRRLDALERNPAKGRATDHRVTATFTTFPSPVWRPPAPFSVTDLWADVSTAVGADTTFSLRRNGTSIGTVTIANGKTVGMASIGAVALDVYDTVDVVRTAGAADATVQMLGTSQHPITPSLGGNGESPAGRLRSTTTQTSVPSGEARLVELDYNDFAVGGLTYDTGTNSRLTIPTTGIYTASAQVVALFDSGFSTLTNFTATQQSNPVDDGYYLGFETFTSSTWWTAGADTTNPYSATYQLLTAAFDGTASIQAQVAFDNNGAGYGNSVRVVLKVDGSEIASTSVTYDLDDAGNYPAFVWTCNVEVPITDLATVGVWMEWTDGGSTTGHADVSTQGGQYPIYLNATRVDPPPNVECALVVSDSGDNYVDTIAVSDAPVRVATCTSSAFEAQAGDYVELWCWNPSTNGDVVINGYLVTSDTIHDWLYTTAGKPAYTEMQVGWIAAGSGTRASQGGG